jgi:uncharacterized membrane protein (UPF0127 family)
MRFVTLAVVAGLTMGACSADELYRLEIASVRLRVEVVDTIETRAQGLMFRESMPETHGMLFVFQDVAPRAFYMKNTSIPLSIAFIDERMVIREIYDMEPYSLETVRSRLPAKYALELNQGAFSRLGITTGDRLLPSRALSRRIAE